MGIAHQIKSAFWRGLGGKSGFLYRKYLHLIWRLRPTEREALLVPRLIGGLHGGVAIDVGANEGFYCLWLRRRADRVIAFEPNPSLVVLLQETLPRDVTIEAYAVSDGSDVAVLRIPVIANVENLGMSTLAVDNRFETEQLTSQKEVRVPTISIDEYVRAHCSSARISFIKIDVEGHEEAVLRGAVAVIREHHPVLLVESELRHGADIPQIFRMLAELGYRGYRVRGDGRGLIPVVADEVPVLQSDERLRRKQADVHDTSYINNFFFLSPERHSRLVSEQCGT